MLKVKNWCFAKWLLGRAGSGVQVSLWNGELGDHVMGRFVTTQLLELEGYGGRCM